MSDEVLLLGYPVLLGALSQEHLDGLVREFQLIALSSTAQRSSVPARLLDLVDALTSAYSAELAEPERLRDEALREGRRRVDLRYPVRPETREALAAWTGLLAEVDEFCRGDDLLVLARSPELVALQDWVVGEFLAQLDGKEPTAWAGPV